LGMIMFSCCEEIDLSKFTAFLEELIQSWSHQEHGSIDPKRENNSQLLPVIGMRDISFVFLPNAMINIEKPELWQWLRRPYGKTTMCDS
jgi:hypothetical protein